MLARKTPSASWCQATVVGLGMIIVSAHIQSAVPVPDLSGSWTLNRALSEFPKEVGFGVDLPIDVSSGTAVPGGGGRGGRRGGGGESPLPNRIPPPQSEEAVAKTEQLEAEARSPSLSLTIVQTAGGISIKDADGRTRVFHTNGTKDVQMLSAGPVYTTAKWSGASLTIEYTLDPERQLRYTYEAGSVRSQIRVRAQLMMHRRGGIITRVYEKTD